jgi:hypothetical protein
MVIHTTTFYVWILFLVGQHIFEDSQYFLLFFCNDATVLQIHPSVTHGNNVVLILTYLHTDMITVQLNRLNVHYFRCVEL